jgi:uncharacterized protein
MKLYHAAVKLADAMIARFYDRAAGAFYDTAAPAPGSSAGRSGRAPQAAAGLAHPRRQPHRRSALLRLEALSGRRSIARSPRTRWFLCRHRGALRPLRRQLRPGPGAAPARSGAGRRRRLRPGSLRLEALAMARFAVNKTVMRIAPSRSLGICRGRTCLPPGLGASFAADDA